MLARGWPVLGLTVALAAALLCNPPAVGQPPDEAGVAPAAPAPDRRPDSAFADPAVAQLQRRASHAQTELAGLQDGVRAAEAELADARRNLEGASAERKRADAAVAALRADMDRMAFSAFADLGTPSGLRVMLTAADADEFLDGVELLVSVRADLDLRMNRAVRAQQAAAEAERAAAAAERDAATRHAELDRATSGARDRAHVIAAEMNAALAELNGTVEAMQRAQHELNERTAANWHAYLDRLRAAGITPPPATALRDPARLPPGVRPMPGSGGAPQAGVARATLADGAQELVLPAETVRAVSAAVAALGRPYAPGRGGEGPDAYSCEGLIRTAFGLGGDPAELLATLLPVPPADAQPGDLVFVGPPSDGVQHVGVALDSRTMLAADARLAGVAVTDVPSGDALLGVARPTLGRRPPAPVPARAAGGPQRHCNGFVLPPGASGTWGGFPNGMIPTAALCPVGDGHRLRCDAALGYRAMSGAFAATFGRGLCLGSSYRPYEVQVRLYAAKPALAAVPGTSNHGWGLAVDLCGGAASFGTAEYAWLAANGRAFGWLNPPWALPGRGREEPWHWEFVG